MPVVRTRARLVEVLEQDRATAVCLRYVALTDRELEAMARADNLRCLDFQDYAYEVPDAAGDVSSWNTSTVDVKLAHPELLAKVLNQLEEVSNWTTGMTDLQLKEFFKQMNENSRLKKLGMGMNPKSVDPVCFATAVTRLEEFDLDLGVQLDLACDFDCDFCNYGHRFYLRSDTENMQHLTKLFSQMNTKSNLKTLRLREIDLSLVDPNLFTSAVSGLENLNLSMAIKTDQHTKELFDLKQGTNEAYKTGEF